MTEDKNKLKRYWVEQAVTLALKGQWDEAISVNSTIVSLFPDDADAYNRLGKAYTELGRYREARDAYEHALRIDAFNSIARKNLQRLSSLAVTSPPLPVASAAPDEARLVPQLFLETMGKSGTTALVNLADQETLARVAAGAPVLLEIEGSTLVARSQRGDRLGEVEPRLGKRLINFMRAGNRYAAAITSLDNHTVRIIIRETYQHPSMVGRVSFPPKRSAENGFRAYTKEVLLRYDEEEEDRLPEEGDLGAEGEVVEEQGQEGESYAEADVDEQ